jgi:PAS domain S-box-containing protein
MSSSASPPSPAVALDDERLRDILDAVPDGLVIVRNDGSIVHANPQVEAMLGYPAHELLGEQVETLLPASVRERHTQHRQAYVEAPRVRAMGSGLELSARRHDGSELSVEISLSPVDVMGEPMVMATVRDVSERRAVEAERRHLAAEQARRSRFLDALGHVTSGLLAGIEGRAAYDLIAEQAADLVGSAGAAVTALHRGQVEVLGSEGVLNTKSDRLLYSEPRRVALSDVLTLGQWQRIPPGGPPEMTPGCLIVPFRAASGEVVALRVVEDDDHGHDGNAPTLLSRFADQAGLALELAQARSDQRRLAVSEDRERIARDLHDRVIQRLFAVGMKLQAAAGLREATAMGTRIDDAVDQIDEAIKELRTTIFTMTRPVPVGLTERVHEVAERYAASFSRRPDVVTNGDVNSVPDDIIDEVLAVCSEALSNASRHGQATCAHVQLSVDDGVLVLEVTDDGVGIDDDAQRGNGLDNMESRAHRLGGRSAAVKNRDRGTTLTWTAQLGQTPADQTPAD